MHYPPRIPLSLAGGGQRCRNSRQKIADDHAFPLTRSISASRSRRDCLHAAASGLLARNAASARSIALSTACQSAAARGFSDGSASSHEVSRSLIRVFAVPRLFLSTSEAVSTTIARNGDRSPSLDAVAASADAISAPVGPVCAANNTATASNGANAALNNVRWVMMFLLRLVRRGPVESMK